MEMDILQVTSAQEILQNQDLLIQIENIEKEIEVLLKNYLLFSRLSLAVLALLTGFIVASTLLQNLLK